jgi:hypothetical protein
VEIVEQSFCGGIATGRILLQGFKNDRVDVAAKLPPQSVRCGQYGAGRLGFCRADDALDLGRCLTLEMVNATAGQDLI